MPTNLDECLNNLFEPGNIGSSSGEIPVTQPSTYSPSWDFTKTYNSQFMLGGLGPSLGGL